MSSLLASAPPPLLSDALLRRLDQPGPRYTSYPTADRFVEAFGPGDYRQALQQRAQGAVIGGAPPLGLYVHIPFCESLCYYCACNKIVTKQHSRAKQYLELLRQEAALHLEALTRPQAITQLHLGGGTPTFLNDDELLQLMEILGVAFRSASGTERAIEIDPRTVDSARLRRLRAMGFNRISFGVQDFDPQVQSAIHRVQPLALVDALMGEAHSLDFESINVDLIYGLPRQTAPSFQQTLSQVVSLRPTRIALYAYAHLPQRFKPQRRLDGLPLPDGESRTAMLRAAIDTFGAAGYQYIGMDHFALPDDALAVAKRQGRLQRNFQGYTAQADGDLIALGVSAIGRLGATYSQNAKTLEEYQDALEQGQLPIVRGLSLSRDDLLRRSVIMALMCQGRVDIESIELSHLINFRQTFAPELAELEALEAAGLVEVSPQAIQLTPLGWYGVRAVAMIFDRHLRADQARQRFSRII